ncbi:MAG TPA: cytochrome c3 family protein [Anaerolineaceae bacterium]|nr:cytochrome c3 family protein [Anaerolineaceae bacterium]
MPQIFSPRSNFFSRASIVLILILGAVITGVLVWYFHSPKFTRVGAQIPQPVPFPHSLHVGGLGLNCRYCHEAVDQSSFADIPPAQTCMSCHSQVATDAASLQPIRDSYATGKPVVWNRVNNLPDFVYFNHQIHVNKGVGCETCHGRMDQVTTAVRAKYFYMTTCTQCHKDPSQYLRPKENVYDMGYQPKENQAVLGARLMQEYHILPTSQLNNCSICHR